MTRFESALIVDDHPLFCDALSMTLSTVAAIDHIRTADTLDGALGQLAAAPATGIVFLDLNLPDVNGLDGLIRLINAAPDVPVIVVSSMAEPPLVAATIRAGARGFVPKHSKRDVFRQAFEMIERGGIFVPDGLYAPEYAQTSAMVQRDALARLSQLTNQQGRILALICEGKLNKQIAFDLSIAETTVKAHVTAIMRKLGVQSRTQAVLIAQEARFANILPNLGEAT